MVSIYVPHAYSFPFILIIQNSMAHEHEEGANELIKITLLLNAKDD